MFCKQCGTQIKDTAKFCPGCGAKIEGKASPEAAEACPACGALLKAGAKFCKQCGAPAAATPRAEPEIARCLCGAPLKLGARFCRKCGAPAEGGEAAASTPARDEPIVTSDNASLEMPLSSATPSVKKPMKKVSKAAAAQAKSAAVSVAAQKATELVSGIVAAQIAAGECALPVELNPVAAPITAKAVQSLPDLLGGGIKSFFSNLLGIFKNKRKLISFLALSAVWLALNLLQTKGVDSRLLDILSKVTAAGGSLGAGSIVKCFVAALVCSLFGESGFIKKLFSGIGQIFSSFGRGKGSFGGTLLGLGAALLLCRMVGVGDVADAALPVSGLLLAVKSLSGSGYIRRILGAVLPKGEPAATSFLAGWALGFGLAIPVSEYALLGGIVCMAVGLGISVLFRGGKEAAKA